MQSLQQPFATWMLVAAGEKGVHTFPPGQSNPRVTAYHAGTNIAGYDLSLIHI